ncbi:MAG: prepilin-type N-terminal cleavage/methylation domain-containing protein [Planctomycetes bacterium]|nr:prepilin-type N-terminal cleavage/methylation domain-containing protein [Planctomycetota bacterium]
MNRRRGFTLIETLAPWDRVARTNTAPTISAVPAPARRPGGG